MLEEPGEKRLYAGMTNVLGKCLGVGININPNREIILCDGLEFPCEWKPGGGYFLVKIEDGMICVGYVDGCHHLNLEFRGSDPEPLIHEIIRRDFVDKSHAAYIAAEIMLAHRCLLDGREYVQR